MWGWRVYITRLSWRNGKHMKSNGISYTNSGDIISLCTSHIYTSGKTNHLPLKFLPQLPAPSPSSHLNQKTCQWLRFYIPSPVCSIQPSVIKTWRSALKFETHLSNYKGHNFMPMGHSIILGWDMVKTLKGTPRWFWYAPLLKNHYSYTQNPSIIILNATALISSCFITSGLDYQMT